MKVPKRWLNYTESGRIRNTRFVVFKTPLTKEFRGSQSKKRFTPQDLLQMYPDLKLVIDLTFTTRYYNGTKEFEAHGVQFIKIKCKGHVVPEEEYFKIFVENVENFLENTPQNYLIGVHCTHGVNRTGYFIVRYMIEHLGYNPKKALREFLESRGHAIERTNYLADLLKRKKL